MKFLLCLGLSWLIMNGWAFVFVLFDVEWMRALGGAWIAILIMPNGVGFFVSLPLSLFLARVLFPNDKKLIGQLNKLRKNRVRDIEESK